MPLSGRLPRDGCSKEMIQMTLSKKKTQKKTELKNKKTKMIALFAMMLILLTSIFAMSVITGNAKTYVTIRIDYCYINGSPAHDPYIATFPLGEAQDYEVTNPTVSGFEPMVLTDPANDPMELPDGGKGEEKTRVVYNPETDGEEVNYTVYYVAGMTHYAARYYLQNKYDDLYTLDRDRTNANQNRLGKTGSTPDDLEAEKIPGFTSLFHEPDAIAADGSTVFRVYYDRNYYALTYDLGEGGYNVEPVYAKYETTFRIKEPKRVGYRFLGWARTDEDSTKGTYGEDWHYIDPETDTNAEDFDMSEHIWTEDRATATDNLIHFNEEESVPAENRFYKAIWAPGDTSFSVVYWIENADSELTNTDADFQHKDGTPMTEDEIKEKIAQNYSVVAAKDVYQILAQDRSMSMHNVTAGMTVTPETYIRNFALKAFDEEVGNGYGAANTQLGAFFDFNLNYADPDDPRNEDLDPNDPDYDPNKPVYKYDSRGWIIDFNDISKGESEELSGHEKYFEMNTAENTRCEYLRTDTEKTVRGDGTTRLNVFYKRKDFTMKFYYARVKNSDNTISLTNSTKGFSNSTAKIDNPMFNVAMEGGGGGAWADDIADTLPQLNPKYTNPSSPDYIPGFVSQSVTYKDYTYYYYVMHAKYNAPLKGKWLVDSVTSVHRKNKKATELCVPGSIAVENRTNYYDSHKGVGNYTIKGFYEKLGDELMFANRDKDYTTLQYLVSWTNTGNNGWNGSYARVLHFRYDNYVELLPLELEDIEQFGEQHLINNGTYIDIITRTFTDLNGDSVTKTYGLKKEFRIETIDSGDQYDRNKSLETRNLNIRLNQTPSDITGFEIENYAVYRGDGQDDEIGIEAKYKGQIKLNDNNTEIDWSEDTDTERRATIRYFFRRRVFTLKYRNGNRKDESHTHSVMYGAPLNSIIDTGEHAGEYRYYWPDPEYFIESLQSHYLFAGWHNDPWYEDPVDLDTKTMPADDDTLYAKWVPKKINVVFYSNYEDYYIDRKGTHPEKRIVLGKDEDDNNITTLSIDYGSYTPLINIPVNDSNPANPRPKLTPIAEEATFAGWYYISSRIPNRFEPENVPITTLNEESTGDNATLRLFAEWVTTDVAKYRVRYVRADDPEVEIAQQTTGRAYVFKTKTFEAKSSAELYDDYKWTSEGQENGTNWWPTINSHSIVIRENNAQGGNEYTPNDYVFTYIQKDKVHYRVQYLDAATRQPINPGKEDVVKETSYASVVEDSLIIPGYIVETASQSLTLTASAKTDPDEQRAEELENNVITFLYRENKNEYLYQVDYLTQDISDNGNYSLYTSETLTVPIAAEGDTTVSISDLYTNPVVTDLLGHGYTLVTGGTKYTVTDEYGITDPELHPVADDGSVTIIPTDKKTIKIYLNRKAYPYCYQYVDHTAESAYLKYLEEHKDDADLAEEIPWDGVIHTFYPESQGLVGQEITIDADYNCSREEDGETLDYVRLTNPDGSLNDVKLTIQPDEDNAGLNTVKIYYRRDVERELNYQMVCVNSHIDTDYYNDAAHTPKFGRLTVSMQTVLDYDSISNVTFHDTNNEITGYTKDNKPIYLHMHRYTFLGWYTTPDYDPEHPEEGRLTQNETLTKENLGTDGKLPSKDTKYYALVEQDMVKLDIMFYYADDYTKESFSNASDEELAPIVQNAVDNADNPDTTEKVYPDSARIGQEPVFTSPSNYTNHAELAWHRVDGYSFSMQPIDNRVYKYEFVEWWQITPTPIIDPETGEQVIRDELVRHYNWNSPSIEWSSDALQQQIPRNKDQYLIAVYARREVEELPYTINYVFKSRIGSNDEERTKVFVKNGVLSKEKDELTEGVEGANLTTDGDYRLTDEFILTNAPYESNYGETLLWSNRDGAIVSTSQKEGTILEDKTTVTADRAYATITAIQDTKVVYAHYRMNPDEGYTNDPIVCAYGDNHNLNPNMKTLNAPESYNGKAFSYWAVRKSGFDSAPVIAKSYDRLFDLCMMDSYWLTPVYEEVSEEPAAEGTSVTLTHLDYTRNRWTDGDGNIPESGETDLLFADFEIAFEDNGKDIYDSESYKTGVILEYCAKVPDNVTFNPTKDYKQTTNYETLSFAVTEYLQNKPVTQYSYKEDKNRTIQFCEIPTASLTDHNRVEFGKFIKNAFTTTNIGTEEEPEYTYNYTNSIYLLKATAYLVDGDGNVTFSKEPVYVCYKGIASQNSALSGMTEIADN